MKFHHLAYLVKDTASSAKALEPFFPKIVVYRKAHEHQHVYITYLTTPEGTTVVELVEPFSIDSVLGNKLAREPQNCIPYHVCFFVEEFEFERARLLELGWITLTSPFPALDENQVASHLFRRDAGIIEILGFKK